MDGNEISKRALTLEECMHVDEDGVEYWYAREIMEVFGYSKWQNFEIAIERARVSLETTKTAGQEHFAEVSKSLPMPKGGYREVKDFMLTRYACYLIAMNGDPRKEEIAFAQSYFALKTREREVIEERMQVIARLAARDGLTEAERLFSANMYERGVDADGIGRVRSKGDAALFGGVTTSGMKKRLGVKSGPLADHLPGVTLAAKQLATELTNYNIVENDLHGEAPITKEHVSNNLGVRELLGKRGVKPEELPAEEDAKKLKRRVDSDAKKLEKEAKGFRSSNQE